MPKTLVEKIFNSKLKRDDIKVNDVLFVPVDLVIGTDVTVPLSAKIFKEMNGVKVFDKTKIAFFNDHFVPAKDIEAAKLAQTMRNFAQEQEIEKYYELGRAGICHISVPEKGLVVPGDIVVGADSHTCTMGALGAFSTGIGSTDMAAAWALGELWFTVPQSIKVIFTGIRNKHVTAKDIILYLLGKIGQDGAINKVLEFTGEVIQNMDMAERFTITNMAIEAGAKAGLIEADEKTYEYLKDKTDRKIEFLKADKDAEYIDIIEIDISEIQPLVAVPPSPDKIVFVQNLSEIKINQVLIGSCTNGRIEDIRLAHKFLKNKKVHPFVRLIITPGSPRVLQQMNNESITNDLIEAGAILSPSTCGACIGGHMGVLANNEVGLFTTNRNFIGRNGDKSAKVYICSPIVAAASAVAGKIIVPD